jgi:molybdopterin-guanine dinucleotide biosynthesis protein A
MRLLGAVLAGGRSSRFGSDKALAEWNGRPLLAHAAEALAAQCETVIVCGREWPGLVSLPDRPEPDLGPLGGLNAALRHALVNGFDAVLSVGCDTPVLPTDLAARLSAVGEAAYLEGMPVIGRWPARLAAALDKHLTESDDRSMRAWGRVALAVAVEIGQPLANVNRPEDLDAINASRRQSSDPRG